MLHNHPTHHTQTPPHFCHFCCIIPCRLRKLDPEEEDDPFNNYEVQSEAKLESFPSVGPHRMSFDSTTFMESGRNQTVSGYSASHCPVTCLHFILEGMALGYFQKCGWGA